MKDLTKDPNAVLRRGGTGTNSYGLYIDFAVFSKSTGKLHHQERYFVAGSQICKYLRNRGNKRAAWRAFPLPSHDDARNVLMRNLKRYADSTIYGVELLSAPMLVELTTIDVQAIEKGEAPPARNEGSRATEKAVGKLDDERIFTVGSSAVPF